MRAEAGGGRRGRCATLGGRDARVVGARMPAVEKPGRCTARHSEAPPVPGKLGTASATCCQVTEGESGGGCRGASGDRADAPKKIPEAV